MEDNRFLTDEELEKTVGGQDGSKKYPSSTSLMKKLHISNKDIEVIIAKIEDRADDAKDYFAKCYIKRVGSSDGCDYMYDTLVHYIRMCGI